MTRISDKFTGFGRSDAHTFTIPTGTTGSAVAPVNLGRNYAYIIIKCDDASNIAAASNLSAQVGYADNDTLATLYEIDDPSTAWSKGSLPTTGSFTFLLVRAFAAQRIRLILSNNATGTVTFTVYGTVASVDP